MSLVPTSFVVADALLRARGTQSSSAPSARVFGVARVLGATQSPFASARGHPTHNKALPLESVYDLASVDAWSVTDVSREGIRVFPQGSETTLFQVGLAPYLAYLWFLGKTRATPRTSELGARFLLLFVAATIPAGIVAKAKYGDILANVDLLHGGSESLLTISNALFAFGFGSAAAQDAGDESDSGASISAIGFLGVLLLACAAGTLALDAGAGTVIGADVLESEPTNALSLPTWAVHVSSVTEWALAMKYVAGHADRTKNERWCYLTVAMSPFLASGFTACTFHAFYNPSTLNQLVPLQATLTLLGNAGCAIAAYRISKNDDVDSSGDVTEGLSASEIAITGEPPIENGASFALKLDLWTSLASAAVKYGELGVPVANFFAEPSYGKALAMIALPSVVWTYYALNSGERAPTLSMKDVKSFGVAGTVSYVVIELAFWAIAGPLAFTWYKVAEGTWLDLSDPVDKAKLFGAGAVFINVVRLFVPLRLAAALALAPYVATFIDDDGDDETAE